MFNNYEDKNKMKKKQTVSNGQNTEQADVVF